MKKILLVAISAILLLLNFSCKHCPDGSDTKTKPDTSKIVEWYLKQRNKLYTDTSETAFHSLIPELLQGGPVSTADAVQQVDTFINLIQPEEEPYTLRSFFVNASVFREYIAADRTKQIVSFKLCIAYDTAFARGHSNNPITELVIAGVDKDGNYILNPTGGFYDQIAGCPAICQDQGESQYDNLILDPHTAGRIMVPVHRLHLSIPPKNPPVKNTK